jgi:carboxypeptidase Q
MHRLLLLLLLATLPAQAQTIEERIYDEGMRRSEVMQTLHVLTDVHGPRLTGSPHLARAGGWALDQMQAWGLANPTRAPWDWGRVGWTNEYLAAHMETPVSTPLVAEALGWTPSTNGVARGPALHVVPPQNVTWARLRAWEDSVRTAVRGSVVLVGNAGPGGVLPPSLAQRLTDDEARRRFTPRPDANPGQGNRPGGPPQQRPADGIVPNGVVAARVDSVLRAGGALVRVNPAGMENGLIRAFSNRTFDPATALPTIVLRDEDYGRIARLIAHGRVSEAPVVAVDVRNTVYPNAQMEHNYLAEIPGTNPGEVVMLGGHLDSWHAATGATDNAAGSAVMMEAGRILAKVFRETNTRPRRTIRVALWTGEEQGLLGSRAYVERTFGTAENPTAAYAGFNGYFNVDSGTGRLRGASVFGPPEAAEMLDGIFEPLDSLGVAGATTSRSRAIGGSDHTSFNNAGLPGIGMGQDPIAYFTTTWHTNVDTYERLLPKDLMQAAVTVALGVYRLATMEQPLPRFQAADMPPNPNAPRPAPGSR